ncbi:unnamed protein product [Heligmosomoides polygyrus]|uniref:SET domain-containing protein n=1 Tax=Heligmosomoides polygyrus TaxID=6339 RepID=A0A183GC73_HELPZ|nr:unnamed protein product [Heligmosomoides polygyrus]
MKGSFVEVEKSTAGAVPFVQFSNATRDKCIEAFSPEYSGTRCDDLVLYSVADSIWSYRRVDAILQVLQKSLITAEEEISDECAHRFSNVTLCPKCLTDDTVEYCRDSCQFASFSCLENLAKKWETNIDELYELTRSYNEGFLPIAQVIGSRMRRLLELKAPRLAKVMVSRCGPLHKDSGIYATPLISTKLLKPRDIQPMVKELVDNMRTLRKCWIQIAARTCADASEGEFCWNGTSTVRLQLADDLGIGIKDVRPRPKVGYAVLL